MLDKSHPYLTTPTASSQLKDEGDFTYSPSDTIDRALETSWAEGDKGTGVGQWIQYQLDGAYRIEKLKLVPGCGFTPQLWLKNERIKKLKITLDGKIEQVAELEDARTPGEWRAIAIQHNDPVKLINLEIMEVYPGTTWKDGCISEVTVEPKLAPVTGELDKSSKFLGLTCKSDWAAIAAQWKVTGKPKTGYGAALDDVNQRLGKPNLLKLTIHDDKAFKWLALGNCNEVSAVSSSLGKDDLVTRLCGMKMEDVRKTFRDSPVKRRVYELAYPWGGGTLNVDGTDTVNSVELDCLPR